MTERLDRLGLDPIAALARLAQHAEAEGDLALAQRCWSGLLPYAGSRPTLPREGFSALEKGPPAEGISRPEKTPASEQEKAAGEPAMKSERAGDMRQARDSLR